MKNESEKISATLKIVYVPDILQFDSKEHNKKDSTYLINIEEIKRTIIKYLTVEKLFVIYLINLKFLVVLGFGSITKVSNIIHIIVNINPPILKNIFSIIIRKYDMYTNKIIFNVFDTVELK